MTINAKTVAKMSLEERYRLLELLVESIRTEHEAEPIPDWHLELVRQRLEQHKKNPTEGKPWREVMEQLGAKLKKAER